MATKYYPSNVSTPTAIVTTVLNTILVTIKLLQNSVLSTSNTRFASSDLANFYLNNPIDKRYK